LTKCSALLAERSFHSFVYVYTGVPRDVDRAVDWYVRASLEGSVKGSFDAMFNLGMCFRKGVGRPQVFLICVCTWVSVYIHVYTEIFMYL